MINATNARLKSIRFAIPESAVARHPGTILTVRELRAWSESLPFGNPPRAAQLLLQQLRLLVRDPDPGSKFSALLDAYDEPTLRLLEIVNEREAAESGFLVPLDQLEHALRDLLAELAHGRLRMANRLLNAGKAVPADLLYRAFDLLDAADDIERQVAVAVREIGRGRRFELSDRDQQLVERIVAVDGRPVADLDGLLAAVAEKRDGESVRLDTLDLDGKPDVITLKLDLEFWPTYELRRLPSGWERLGDLDAGEGTRWVEGEDARTGGSS